MVSSCKEVGLRNGLYREILDCLLQNNAIGN